MALYIFIVYNVSVILYSELFLAIVIVIGEIMLWYIISKGGSSVWFCHVITIMPWQIT